MPLPFDVNDQITAKDMAGPASSTSLSGSLTSRRSAPQLQVRLDHDSTLQAVRACCADSSSATQMLRLMTNNTSTDYELLASPCLSGRGHPRMPLLVAAWPSPCRLCDQSALVRSTLAGQSHTSRARKVLTTPPALPPHRSPSNTCRGSSCSSWHCLPQILVFTSPRSSVVSSILQLSPRSCDRGPRDEASL
jgi:hypothetical protein